MLDENKYIIKRLRNWKFSLKRMLCHCSALPYPAQPFPVVPCPSPAPLPLPTPSLVVTINVSASLVMYQQSFLPQMGASSLARDPIRILIYSWQLIYWYIHQSWNIDAVPPTCGHPCSQNFCDWWLPIITLLYGAVIPNAQCGAVIPNAKCCSVINFILYSMSHCIDHFSSQPSDRSQTRANSFPTAGCDIHTVYTLAVYNISCLYNVHCFLCEHCALFFRCPPVQCEHNSGSGRSVWSIASQEPLAWQK